jgi:hypothetical protein
MSFGLRIHSAQTVLFATLVCRGGNFPGVDETHVLIMGAVT